MFWYGGGWGWTLGSLFFWVLLVVAIVALVGLFARGNRRMGPPYPGYVGGPESYSPPGPAPGPAPSPEQILAERFARGEITQDEFRESLAALRAEVPGAGPGAATTAPGPDPTTTPSREN
jgi:putative membrane protein